MTDTRETKNIITKENFDEIFNNLKDYIDYKDNLIDLYNKALELGYNDSKNKFVESLVHLTNDDAKSDLNLYKTALEQGYEGSIEDFALYYLGLEDSLRDKLTASITDNLSVELKEYIDNEARTYYSGLKKTVLWEGALRTNNVVQTLNESIETYDLLLLEGQYDASSKSYVHILNVEDIVSEYNLSTSTNGNMISFHGTNYYRIKFYNDNTFKIINSSFNTGANLSRVTGVKFELSLTAEEKQQLADELRDKFDATALTVRVSDEEGNALVNKEDGLYVPTTTSVKVSDEEGNALVNKEDGLYVPATDLSAYATNDDVNAIKYDIQQKFDEIIGTAPETLDTIHELAQGVTDNKNIIDAINDAITNKADKTELHTHDNKEVLDLISTDEEENLIYNGKKIQTEINVSTEFGNALVEKEDGLYVSTVKIDPVEYINNTQSIEDTPVGHILSYANTVAPAHYLICDGTEYNIADYPYLAQHILNNFGIVNYFGGDGETTFAVPKKDKIYVESVPVMTSNTTPSPYVVSCSTHWDNRYPYLAFNKTNKDSNDNWETIGTSDTNPWIQVYHPNGISISKFSITNRNSNANSQYPKTISVVGSNDETDWTTLLDTTTLTWDTQNQTQEFILDNTYKFKYIRLYAYSGGYYTDVARFDIYAINYIDCIKYEPTYYMNNTFCLQPTFYSEEEKVVGSWTNGKPLYQKVITGTTSTSNDTSKYDIGIDNYDHLSIINGMIDNLYPINYGSYVISGIRDKQFFITITDTGSTLFNKEFYVVLQYTKTTDEENSFTNDMITDYIPSTGTDTSDVTINKEEFETTLNSIFVI